MEKIAIVRRNGLGDLLCAYPLVLYLRRHRPDAAITLFVDERNAHLIPYLPQEQKVVVLPKKGIKYFNLLKLALQHRREKFDMAISAKTSSMKLMNLFLFFLGAKKRVAVVDESWHRYLVNVPVQFESHEMHQALKTLKMVAPHLESVPEYCHPVLKVPREIEERYEEPSFMKTPRLLISATTTKPASRLIAKRYAAIASKVANRYMFSISLVSMKSDERRAQEIAEELQAPYRLHFPRNFDEFMVMLGRSDLFFVGDGGPAHIGSALGKRGVVLFGEASPDVWGPMSEKFCSHYHKTDVNELSDEEITMSLSRQCEEVLSERLLC